MECSDATLLNQWRMARNADAFQELVVRHAQMVHGTCLRILHNATDAEEITQECLLELAEASARIRGAAGGWLHGVAVRKSRMRLRAEIRRQAR